MKRPLKIILGLIIGFLFLFGLYLFNADKFYPEYWLQKNIDELSIAEKLESIENTNQILIYQFYYDSGIDIQITLNSNGEVLIARNMWFSESKNKRFHTFKGDKLTIQNLIKDFKTRYVKSEQKDIDDHIGGIYATLTLLEKNPNNEIQIGFYNVIPDNTFRDLKNRIIEIGNSVIDK